jgi:hypothetical protein
MPNISELVRNETEQSAMVRPRKWYVEGIRCPMGFHWAVTDGNEIAYRVVREETAKLRAEFLNNHEVIT